LNIYRKNPILTPCGEGGDKSRYPGCRSFGAGMPAFLTAAERFFGIISPIIFNAPSHE